MVGLLKKGQRYFIFGFLVGLHVHKKTTSTNRHVKLEKTNKSTPSQQFCILKGFVGE
jgi:hypothetical protein